MVKTQIQLSDELYARVKKLAERKEWSLAEAFRRGAELLLQQYPHPESVRNHGRCRNHVVWVVAH
jgi:hypothetical protein